MTLEEIKISQLLDKQMASATAPFEERINEFELRIQECDELIASLPDYKAYILNGGESKEYHSLKKRCEIAEEDKFIFKSIITDFNKEITGIRVPFITSKSNILNEVNNVIHVKAGILTQLASGRDMGIHERQFKVQLDILKKALTDIPEALSKPLIDNLLQIENYSLKEIA